MSSFGYQQLTWFDQPCHRLASVTHVSGEGPRVCVQPIRSRGHLTLGALPAAGDAAWAGVPLARLLWQLPPAPAAALLEALLLERRVLLVSRDAGTVSTAAVACAAALHPFAWHHIFVPLLPPSMKARMFLLLFTYTCPCV